jgi:uncharacterized protein (DUF488 family)
MIIYTIGFTKKNAEQFFNRLKQPGLNKIIDARLNNVSQLAGFTKKDDLRFFLKEILNIGYTHLPILAPTQEILDDYKKNNSDWSNYQKRFLKLLQNRKIKVLISPSVFDGGCLLCIEPTQKVSSSSCCRIIEAEMKM